MGGVNELTRWMTAVVMSDSGYGRVWMGAGAGSCSEAEWET